MGLKSREEQVAVGKKRGVIGWGGWVENTKIRWPEGQRNGESGWRG